MMTTRATKIARATRVRATRARAMKAMTETSPRKKGYDGHNNQLGTKAVAMARTVVAMTARATTMGVMATVTGAKKGDGNDGDDGNGGNDDAKR